MEDFEEAALTNYPTGDDTTSPSYVILFWLRKADDTLVAVHNDHIHRFIGRTGGLSPCGRGVVCQSLLGAPAGTGPFGVTGKSWQQAPKTWRGRKTQVQTPIRFYGQRCCVEVANPSST